MVIRNGKEEILDSDEIVVGDIVIVKPGEKIATDGEVIDGESSLDESMITGESIPVQKKIGDRVTGGTLNKNGYLQFKATNVGSNTVLASIIDMVRKARMSKALVVRVMTVIDITTDTDNNNNCLVFILLYRHILLVKILLSPSKTKQS